MINEEEQNSSYNCMSGYTGGITKLGCQKLWCKSFGPKLMLVPHFMLFATMGLVLVFVFWLVWSNLLIAVIKCL